MTTAVSATSDLTPSAQIQQFCHSITSLFDSLSESTDSAFQRVHVTKRDASGQIRTYQKEETVIDPVTGGKTTVTKQISDLTYIEDVKTGELYRDEPTYTVATKCALIATLGIPLYTFAKMGWNAIKTPLEIGRIAIDAIAKIGQLFFSGNGCEAATEAQREIIQIFETLSTGLFEIVKAPLFGLGCELAAIYGIFKPYHGRKFEAMIENAWQQGASHKVDFRNVPKREDENCLTAFVKDLRDCHTFYLSHCFQVRGNTHDPLVTVTSRGS